MLVGNFKPKNNVFFALFSEAMDIIHQSAQSTKDVMDNFSLLAAKTREVKDLESKCDEVTTQIVDKVNQTFITPFDREDIFRLTQNLDDMADLIYGTLERMLLYNVGEPNETVRKMIDICLEMTTILQTTVGDLDKLAHRREKIIEECRAINQLETDGDHLYREGMARMFADTTNAIEIIKLKTMYEHIESLLDAGEDLGDTIKGLVLKYA